MDIDNKKADPTLRKYENPGATVIQMLLAAKEGDVVFLKRYRLLIYISYMIIKCVFG